MSSRQDRLELIKSIEEERKSKVLIYFCSDGPIIQANIAPDAIRPLYDHLLTFVGRDEKIKKLDFYLYSVGGRLEIPWRIVTMLREFTEQLNVIIPYKAYSAATLIALGADKIVMGRKGELSPIDPSLHLFVPETGRPPKLTLPPEVGVEDISSYITFVKERAGLTDQKALAEVVSILAEELTPPVLGQIQRAHSHIRLVARKLLSLCRPPIEERRITTIVEALAEKIYLHGHGIGRKEAQEIGLQIEEPSRQLEELSWKLYLSYEKLMKFEETPDAFAYFKNDSEDEYRDPGRAIGCIESTDKFHEYEGTLILRRMRRIPSQLVININVPLQLPPVAKPEDFPKQIQQQLQKLLQEAGMSIREQVTREIARQSPVQAVVPHLLGGRWIEKKG